MIRTALSLLAALSVTSMASAALGQAVVFHDQCGDAAQREVLSRETSAVAVRLSEVPSPPPNEDEIQGALLSRNASVLLWLDEDCIAHVYGVNGQRYDFEPEKDVSAWAVRVAETLYALSPYKAELEAPQSADPAPELEPSTPTHVDLSVAAGPFFLSGSNGARALISGQLGVSPWPWFALVVQGAWSLQSSEVESAAASAEVLFAYARLAARLSLLQRASWELSIDAGAGPSWINARGTAQAPRENAEESTMAFLVSSHLEVHYFLTPRFGLMSALSAGMITPRVDLALGEDRAAIGRFQGALLLGPMLRL